MKTENLKLGIRIDDALLNDREAVEEKAKKKLASFASAEKLEKTLAELPALLDAKEKEVREAAARLGEALGLGEVKEAHLRAFFEAKTKLGVSEIRVDDETEISIVARLDRNCTPGVIFEVSRGCGSLFRKRFALLWAFPGKIILLPLEGETEAQALRGLSGEEVLERWLGDFAPRFIDPEGRFLFVPIDDRFAPEVPVREENLSRAGNFVKIAGRDVALRDLQSGKIFKPGRGATFFVLELAERFEGAKPQLLARKKREFFRKGESVCFSLSLEFEVGDFLRLNLGPRLEVSLTTKRSAILRVSAHAKNHGGSKRAFFERKAEVQVPAGLEASVLEALPSGLFARKVFRVIDRALAERTWMDDPAALVIRVSEIALWRVLEEVERIRDSVVRRAKSEEAARISA